MHSDSSSRWQERTVARTAADQRDGAQVVQYFLRDRLAMLREGRKEDLGEAGFERVDRVS